MTLNFLCNCCKSVKQNIIIITTTTDLIDVGCFQIFFAIDLITVTQISPSFEKCINLIVQAINFDYLNIPRQFLHFWAWTTDQNKYPRIEKEETFLWIGFLNKICMWFYKVASQVRRRRKNFLCFFSWMIYNNRHIVLDIRPWKYSSPS